MEFAPAHPVILRPGSARGESSPAIRLVPMTMPQPGKMPCLVNRPKTTLALAAVCAALLAAIAGAVPAHAQIITEAKSGPGQGGVLVVGDSLEVLTSPYIQRYVPVPVTVNAVGGYNSYQIYDLFQESWNPSFQVVVFDAGTNDNPQYPEILAGNLAKVAATVGPNTCLVVPTIHGFTVNGYNNDGKNNVVMQFAASRPGTQTPDWATFEQTHPELMQADDLHPIAQGADARAQLIAQGVKACLNGGSSGGVVTPPLTPAQVRHRKLPVAVRQSETRAVAALLVSTEVFDHIAAIARRQQRQSAMGGVLLLT